MSSEFAPPTTPTKMPAVIAPDGEVYLIDTSAPVTAERAAEMLPRLEETYKSLGRFINFLRTGLMDSLLKAQTPRQVVGERIIEVSIEEGDWVCDGAAMRQALSAFVGVEITEDEWEKAVAFFQPAPIYKPYHNVLNSMAKKGSDALKAAIAANRHKPKKDPTLRIT